jgi:hypothetical protein
MTSSAVIPSDRSTSKPFHGRRMRDPAVTWSNYPRINPGEYQAYCRFAKWYRDPTYKRWTCIIQFEVVAENMIDSLGVIPMWLNGGDGEEPSAPRRSRYFPEWVKANGEPPIREDRMSPRVFTQRMARVRVGDTKGPAPYSVVREILEWHTGQAVNQSHSQGRHR